jgi:rare lipoprotein A
MTGRGFQQVSVIKTIATFPHVRVAQYLRWFILLSAAFCVSRSGQANACAASGGQTGVASWYGPGLQGRSTASGERFDMWAMTAAHPCLPMGTKILVTVAGTGRSLIVTVNDRLHSRRRVLDLSKGAARVLGVGGVAVASLLPTSAKGALSQTEP